MHPVHEPINLPGWRRARVRYAPIPDLPLHSSETTLCAKAGSALMQNLKETPLIWKSFQAVIPLILELKTRTGDKIPNCLRDKYTR